MRKHFDRNHLINRMQKEQKTICEFCGKEKEGLSFFIGATTTPDWCMIEGTGKMSCPDCYTKASIEGQEAVRKATC